MNSRYGKVFDDFYFDREDRIRAFWDSKERAAKVNKNKKRF